MYTYIFITLHIEFAVFHPCESSLIAYVSAPGAVRKVVFLFKTKNITKFIIKI